MSTTPEFYNRFNIPGDFRTKTWLVGPQYYPDGAGGFTTQPVYYPGTTTQIVITPNLVLVPPKPMDVGNTIASQAEGIRSIELSWEGWRRNDLIRWGLYEKEYVLPNDNLSMDKSAYRRLFPIPISEIKLNGNLTQNPGYLK